MLPQEIIFFPKIQEQNQVKGSKPSIKAQVCVKYYLTEVCTVVNIG